MSIPGKVVSELLARYRDQAIIQTWNNRREVLSRAVAGIGETLFNTHQEIGQTFANDHPDLGYASQSFDEVTSVARARRAHDQAQQDPGADIRHIIRLRGTLANRIARNAARWEREVWRLPAHRRDRLVSLLRQLRRELAYNPELEMDAALNALDDLNVLVPEMRARLHSRSSRLRHLNRPSAHSRLRARIRETTSRLMAPRFTRTRGGRRRRRP